MHVSNAHSLRERVTQSVGNCDSNSVTGLIPVDTTVSERCSDCNAEHDKLVPLFAKAGIELPKADATNWWSHNRSLGEQIDKDQQAIYRMQANLRRTQGRR